MDRSDPQMGWARGATIGRGASATVSLAVFTDGILAAKSAPVSASQSLIREESVLADLRGCPHIVACFGHDVTAESGTVAPFHNLFLEYLPRGSLRDALDRSGGPFSEPKARRYAKSTLEGLKFVHAKGYVHCDIKLHNLLLGEDGEVRLADFGLSRNVNDDANEPACLIRGTPMYMSPESVARREYEPPMDIWAVGCAVVEMVSGRSPWRDSGDDVWALMMRIGFGDEVVEIPKGVSDEAKDFLRRCLVRDPKERWTAEMLLDHPFLTVSDTNTDTDKEWLPSPKSVLHFPISEDSLVSLEVSASCAADRVRHLATGPPLDWSCRPTEDGDWISVREAEGGAPVDRIRLLSTGRWPDWWGRVSGDHDGWTCVREC